MHFLCKAPPLRGGESRLWRRWCRLQCNDGRGVARTHRPSKFFLRAIIIVLDEFPGQVRSLLRIDSKHPELRELVGLKLACPCRPEDRKSTRLNSSHQIKSYA